MSTRIDEIRDIEHSLNQMTGSELIDLRNKVIQEIESRKPPTMLSLKIIRWYNSELQEFFYGIDVEMYNPKNSSTKWFHIKDSQGPKFFKKRAEAKTEYNKIKKENNFI